MKPMQNLCYMLTGLFHTKQVNTTQLSVTLWQDCHTKQVNTTQFSVMWWQDCHTKQVNTTQLSVMWWQDCHTKQVTTTQLSVMWWQDCHTKQVNTTQLRLEQTKNPNKWSNLLFYLNQSNLFHWYLFAIYMYEFIFSPVLNSLTQVGLSR